MDFLQKFWHLIQEDIFRLFMEFHESRTFVGSLKSSFLIFTPNVKWAANIKDFKPISLVESVYKLTAKVLTKKMVKVMNRVEVKCEHAFVDKFWMWLL